MNIQQDFKEFLQLLDDFAVEYMIVGGYAVAFHGYPRFTKDIDVFYDNAPENIRSLKKAMKAFGFPEDQLHDELFEEEGTIIQFGYPPCQIDLLNQIDGVKYETAQAGKILTRFDGLHIAFISKEDLIQNKQSTPRLKDKADVEELEKENPDAQ